MSKFLGHLEDENFEFIAIDNFTIEVVKKASVFFLSHYHSDHFSGLRKKDWQRNEVSEIFKRNPEKKLYCSDITRRLFIADDPDRIPESQIVGVPFGACFVVTNSEQDGGAPVYVSVTLISSGHILGATMFLFEHEDNCILFTGDFRICPEDIPKLNALHYRNREVKQITHLYLDTTFGSSSYPKFPLRSKVSSEAVKFISDWLKSNYIVHIDLPYQFGYERFLLDLSQGLNCKIIVDSDYYNSCYSYIPELCDRLRPADYDSNEYKIHAFSGRRLGPKCMFCSRHKAFKIIRPCASSTGKEAAEEKIIYKDSAYGYEIFKIIYSSHCSFEELKSFILYLKPKKITTIVDHNYSALIKIKEELFSLVNTVKESCLPNTNIKQNQRISHLYQCETSDESVDEYTGLAIDSPPR